jgi:hypothetical protein
MEENSRVLNVAPGKANLVFILKTQSTNFLMMTSRYMSLSHKDATSMMSTALGRNFKSKTQKK